MTKNKMRFKYEDINKRCDEVLTKRSAVVAEAQKRVDDINAIAENIRVKVEESKMNGDADGFVKASADLKETMDKQNVLKEWNQNLINEPLISEEEYLELIKEVTEEGLKLADECSAELLKIAESTYEKSKELKDYINKTNAALYKLQHEVFRDKDKPLINGERVQNINVRKCPDEVVEVSLWASVLAKNYMFKKLTGKKVE